MSQIRTATFHDAKAIDAIVEGFSPLRRDLDAWVNQADAHVALVDGDDVVAFAARKRHKEHPQRDLVAFHATGQPLASVADMLRLVAGRKPRPLKLRLPADDAAGRAVARELGFTERIRSATYLVPASAFDAVGNVQGDVEDVDPNRRDLTAVLNALYANTHRWDPPASFTRRYIRQGMLNGAQHAAAVFYGDALVGIGIEHAPADDSCAADVSLVGAIEPDGPDADAVTAALVGHLVAPYRNDLRPIWFEIDTGPGTNEPLARLVMPKGTPVDEIAILTSD